MAMGRSASVVAAGMLLGASSAAAVPPPKLPAGHKPALADGPAAMQLERTSAGGFRRRDRVNGFEATIHRDGSVTFRDIARISLTTNVAPDGADTFGRRLRGSYAPQPSLQAETDNPLIDPKQMPYGEPPILLGIGTKIGGVAEIRTDGQRGKAQRKFLQDTEDLRDRLARSAARRGIHNALSGLRLSLVGIWKQPSRTAVDKRALLFALWDEAAERAPIEARKGISLGGAAALAPAAEHNRRRREAGERARRSIEAFIRAVAPQGSTQAYSASELARLNAGRSSRQRFEPYVRQ